MQPQKSTLEKTNGTPPTTAVAVRMEPASSIIKLMTEYKAFQDELDKARSDLLVQIDGKPYRPKRYWALVARAMRITVELVSEERFRMDAHDPRTGEVWPARVVQTVYKATLGDQMAIGDGACSEDEPRITRTFHNVRARAHTRGWIRAVSNLVAFGEISAEEIEGGYTEASFRK